jgi:hypothetical protein
MPKIVRFNTDEDGLPEEFNNVWHWVDHTGQEDRAFCSGQVFGLGESTIEFEQKIGNITCKFCIDRIKAVKAIPSKNLKP